MSWPVSLVCLKEGCRTESRARQMQVPATALEKRCAKRSWRIFGHLEVHCLQPEPSRAEVEGHGASECKRTARGFCDVWIFVHILIIMLSEEIIFQVLWKPGGFPVTWSIIWRQSHSLCLPNSRLVPNSLPLLTLSSAEPDELFILQQSGQMLPSLWSG